MSVIAVCGLPGSGKTLFCTYIAKKHFKFDNKPFKRLVRRIKRQEPINNVIYSNYPIKLDKKHYSNIVSLFDFARWNRYYPNSDFIFDEFQLYFDSLEYKNFPQIIRNSFQLHRHFGINNIFIISQHPSRIVKQARVLISEFYEITKFIRIPIIGVALFRYNIYYNFDDFGKPVNVKKSEVTYRFKKKILFFRYKKIYKSYDTKYFKKLVEDSDLLYKVMYSDLVLERSEIINNYRI